MEINKLIEIAQNVGLQTEAAQLQVIKERFDNDNCELTLPFVGEFSSGKTTLLNAISDSKKLETAVKPTTATLFEIHFGCQQCCAKVYDENGNETIVEDIASLKNETLGDAKAVIVYDTATKISPEIVLVDTPGLSSPDIRHKQVLIDFLPQADGVLLVVDVNQQITKSLVDFVKTMELAKCPVFLVITKCDTKAASEIESVKKYIAENCNIPIKQVVCVSAVNNDVQQLYDLLNSIQADKGKIIQQVNKQRIAKITKTMLTHIEDMLAVAGTDKELEDNIRLKEYELKKFNNSIDRIISSAQEEIKDIETSTIRNFEDTIFNRLDTIVAGNSNNFNAEAVDTINNVASILLNEYKMKIQTLLQNKVSENSMKEGLTLQSLDNVDVQSLQVKGLSFNLDLDSIGHEYDSAIAGGVKIAAVAAVVDATVATAGAAAAGAAGAAGTGGAAAGAGAAGTATSVGTAVGIADTAVDVGSVVYMSNKFKKMEKLTKTVQYVKMGQEELGKLEAGNQQIGQQVGANKGFVEGLVGFVTDKAWGKPQRRRAIHNYMDSTLVPDFKMMMSDNSNALIAQIRASLKEEAENSVNEKKAALQQLQQQRQAQKEDFEQRMQQLRGYKKDILSI